MIAKGWAGLSLLLLAAASAPERVDWSQSADSDTAEFARTRAICARAIDAKPPVADLPTAAERAALKGCSSENLYYGIGIPADPVKARKCAMTEKVGPGDFPVLLLSGEGMLATIYANGRGAKRDLDVAIHMACRLEDAPAAMDFRIKHLDHLRRDGPEATAFETCHDITSGVSGGICAEHKAAIDRQARARRIARLDQRWTSAQRALFARTYADFYRYAGVAHEMDCFGGTAEAQCMIGGQEGVAEKFLARIETLAAGGTPRADKLPEDLVSPATSGAAIVDRVKYDPDHRDNYLGNQRDAIAARAIFERHLVAFAASAFPRLSAHRVRALFADL